MSRVIKGPSISSPYTYVQIVDVIGGYLLAHSEKELCELLPVLVVRPLIAQKLALDRLQLSFKLVHFSFSLFQLFALCTCIYIEREGKK